MRIPRRHDLETDLRNISFNSLRATAVSPFSCTVFCTFNNIAAIKQFDGCKLFLLPYSFSEDSATVFVDSVCSGVVFRSNHFVEAPVYELYRTVVFDSRAHRPCRGDHGSGVWLSRNSPNPPVLMGAMGSLAGAKAC